MAHQPLDLEAAAPRDLPRATSLGVTINPPVEELLRYLSSSGAPNPGNHPSGTCPAGQILTCWPTVPDSPASPAASLSLPYAIGLFFFLCLAVVLGWYLDRWLEAWFQVRNYTTEMEALTRKATMLAQNEFLPRLQE